jgi:hypothetical protein
VEGRSDAVVHRVQPIPDRDNSLNAAHVHAEAHQVCAKGEHAPVLIGVADRVQEGGESPLVGRAREHLLCGDRLRREGALGLLRLLALLLLLLLLLRWRCEILWSLRRRMRLRRGAVWRRSRLLAWRRRKGIGRAA